MSTTPNAGDDVRRLGRVIAAQRKARGLSQRRLGALAGLHHSFITRLETGWYEQPSAQVLQRVADALGIDVGELLALIGIKPALPEPRAYFRRLPDINAKEAAVLAELVEDYQARHRKEGAA